MKLTYPDYYPDFKCTASACRDNCCIGWEIDIDEKTHGCYLAEPGAFGERLRSNISKEDTPHFLLNGERCPFLNEKNLCDIIISMGEQALCEICDQHPRFHEWFGDEKESGVGLCCEAAAKLILKKKEPVTFLHTETDEEAAEDLEDRAFYEAVKNARNQAVEILQNREVSIWERLRNALLSACEFQDWLDGEEPLEECGEPEENRDESKLLSQIVSFLSGLEPIDTGWPERLRGLRDKMPELLEARNEFFKEYEARMYEYEHLAVYFVYRYMLKAVFDGDVLGKMKFAAVSILFLSVLDTEIWMKTKGFSLDDRVQNAKNYSKELEYCEENMLCFWDESWEQEFLTAENLLFLLKKAGER